jgi:hypothetical protein
LSPASGAPPGDVSCVCPPHPHRAARPRDGLQQNDPGQAGGAVQGALTGGVWGGEAGWGEGGSRPLPTLLNISPPLIHISAPALADASFAPFDSHPPLFTPQGGLDWPRLLDLIGKPSPKHLNVDSPPALAHACRVLGEASPEELRW